MNFMTKATIDLSAIRHNLQQVRRLASTAKIMTVVKADAYGHGLVEVAQTLKDADGLAVARIEEALALRDAGISAPLLLLSAPLEIEGIRLCAEHGVAIVVHTLNTAQLLSDSLLDKPVDIWLKLDSGMHRLGLNSNELLKVEPLLKTSRNVESIVLMTHFSDSEQDDAQITEQQTDYFSACARGLTYPQSLANSGAIIRHSNTHRDWVRPGIMLYGANPLPNQSAVNAAVKLLPAMTLTTKVLAIRHVAKGESVGYNGRWTANQDSTIATLGIGYGDGYPRHAENGTPVIVNGQRAHLVGTVSMDLIIVDISHCHNINIGDEAMLWGDGLPAEEVAAHASTISYELFTSISKRVPRIYINA